MTYATISAAREVCALRIVAMESVEIADQARLFGKDFFTNFTLEDNFTAEAVNKCNVAVKLVTMFLTDATMIALPDVERVWD